MIGYAFCGSFCTIEQSLSTLEGLVRSGYEVLPIMSETAYSTDTRFGKAEELIRQVEELCGEKIIHDIAAAEPIGPKNLLDIIIVPLFSVSNSGICFFSKISSTSWCGWP